MTKYWFKSNIFAQLSEIVEANSEKEVWNKIRNQKSFEEIYNEYIRKNEINKERLAKGY